MGRLYPATLALVLIAGSYAPAAYSQDSEPEQAQSTQESARSLEEIIVVGERTLLSVRYQIRREEDHLYRLFNDLNSNDKFDIKCRMVKRLSHIPRRECEPKFLSRARSANAIMGLADIRAGVSVAGANPISFERGLSLLESESELAAGEGNSFDAMNVEMLRVAMKNPDYFKSLMRIAALKAEFEEKWQVKFGD